MNAVDFSTKTQRQSKVLIVEDVEDLRDLIGLLLEDQGWAVSKAANGQAACEILETSVFDLIVSDLQMPGMDGERLLEHCRLKGMTTPFVLMTGSPQLCDRQAPFQPNAIAVKPLDTASFLALIATYAI